MACFARLGWTAALAAVLIACAISIAHAQSTIARDGAADAADILKVLQVNVLHRHGARSGLPRENATEICTESPCGYLSWAGIEMLLKVGGFLRTRYNTDPSVVSSPMFESPNYDLDVAYSRSTDVLRTLQSAEAFLRGFFPNMSSLYAAIHTMPESTDVLLNSNTQPWLKFFYSNNKALLRAVCNPLTDELFPDWTEITKIGAEIYQEGYCSDYETRSDCVRTLFDIGAAKKAIGELNQYPLLEANFEKLKRVTTVLFDYEYHYNHSDPLMFKQGGRGQPFVQQMVKNMEGVIEGSNTYKLMHYSAHDTSLGPVWGTLGDRTPDGMMPPFAQVLVAELLQNPSTGAHYVRILRGNPGQSPDTKFEFGWDSKWQMQCIDALGTAYKAEGNICPFADFKRFVKWSEPADARGYCYLDQVSIDIADCPLEPVAYGTPPTALVPSTCRFYRSACPQFACGIGETLNSVSMQCVCSKDSCLGGKANEESSGDAAVDADKKPTLRDSNGLSGGAVAGVSLATFCAGAIIAVAATAAICMCKRRRQHQLYVRMSSTMEVGNQPNDEREGAAKEFKEGI
ncbi:membrane-bound acid phosphatase 2, putative [Leishmania donovani]|uniref:Membrane-bound acid phosphatase 2, putative n=1 Tax=Leishmania donovani TaxID=5661 RepID=A0A3Q8IR23_LEIDO|nr:membrane-bound acid phosphatase 2, putative [Leishmania donovani]